MKRDAADTAPAEEAFLAAIAVAREQKARSFVANRASFDHQNVAVQGTATGATLSLAKLYQSTNRTADAHAVLAPTLECFSQTPEFPEIAAAQTLLAALRS